MYSKIPEAERKRARERVCEREGGGGVRKLKSGTIKRWWGQTHIQREKQRKCVCVGGGGVVSIRKKDRKS